MWLLDSSPDSPRWGKCHAICLMKASEASEAVSAAQARCNELLKAKNFAEAECTLAELMEGPGMGAALAQRSQWLRTRATCLVRETSTTKARLEDAEQLARLSVLLEPDNAAARELKEACTIVWQAAGSLEAVENHFHQV